MPSHLSAPEHEEDKKKYYWNCYWADKARTRNKCSDECFGLFADKFPFVQKELLNRYWSSLSRNGTLPDQGSTGWVEWAHRTFLTDTRHTHGSSTPVPALALILQGNENLFLHRTQLACTGSLEEQTNNPASNHVFTVKQRSSEQRSLLWLFANGFSIFNSQQHLIRPDSASHHCSSALETTSNTFLLILTALVDRAPNVRYNRVFCFLFRLPLEPEIFGRGPPLIPESSPKTRVSLSGPVGCRLTCLRRWGLQGQQALRVASWNSFLLTEVTKSKYDSSVNRNTFTRVALVGVNYPCIPEIPSQKA